MNPKTEQKTNAWICGNSKCECHQGRPDDLTLGCCKNCFYRDMR